MKLGSKVEFLKTIERPEIESWKEKEKGFTILSNNQAPFGKYRDYPYTWPLYKAWANNWQMDTENILLTRGAEEGIKLVYDVFAEGRSTIIRPEPTFGMTEVYEQLNNVNVIKLNYNKNFHISIYDWVVAIEKNKTTLSMIYLAIPDNPTGGMITFNDLYTLVNKCKEYNVIVLLDLTYYQYYNFDNPHNRFGEIFDTLDNIIIVDSLSKSHGLAGIRSGAIIASKENIILLSKHRPMEEVNSITVKESIKTMKSKIDYKNYKYCKKWKKRFKKIFPNEYIHTDTNFILLRTNKHIYYYNNLYNNKILTRIDFNNDCMKNIIRIGIGNNKTMKKILRIME